MVNRNKVEADVKEFCVKYPLVSYKKDATIVRADDVPDDLFFIVQGKVSQNDIAPSGNEVAVNIFAKPSFLSIFWLFSGSQNRFIYKAMTPVKVHRVPRIDFQKFMLDNPEVAFVTLQRVVRGLDGFMMRMAIQLYGTAEKKIAIELLLEAKRFHKLDTIHVTLDGNLNELTARTGLARETVSRQIACLIRRGLVKKENNKIVITDVEKLESFMSSDN